MYDWIPRVCQVKSLLKHGSETVSSESQVIRQNGAPDRLTTRLRSVEGILQNDRNGLDGRGAARRGSACASQPGSRTPVSASR